MKIHHYTSIETLSVILEHKTIRFNMLDQVDDREEAIYGSGSTGIKFTKCKNYNTPLLTVTENAVISVN